MRNLSSSREEQAFLDNDDMQLIACPHTAIRDP
jgi:hypothetical protein